MSGAPDAELVGDVALVTGGAGAIGGAIAEGLARAGVAVGLVDVDMERLEEVAGRIASAGSRCHGVPGDVTSPEDVRRVVAEIRSELGAVEILVNTAGIFPRTRIVDLDDTEWDRVMAVNLKSAFLASREVLPGMLDRRRGRIISIGSDLGDIGAAAAAHYAASKAGLHALTRSLAKEVGGDGITVNCVLPGLVDTPMMRGANSPEYIASHIARMPAGRLNQAQDCVGLVVFLATTAAQQITGQTLGFQSGL